jgi:hypothetical protein
LDQIDLLRYLLRALDQLDLRYMLVGSIASAAYGEPRMTQDIDLVVDLREDDVDALCHQFDPEHFYISRDAALQAVRRQHQFNIIHPESGGKIDILTVPRNAWGKTEFLRRQEVQVLPDLLGYCARPEDVILGKMQYYREGGSDKHLRDIAGILTVRGNLLDRQYIRDWSQRLGLLEIWQHIDQ